jgi:TolB protein
MLKALPFPRKVELTRFDGIVISILLGLALFTGFLIWRGDQVGVQIVSVSPADGATGVSTRTDIRITFDQPMVLDSTRMPLTFSPPVSGTIRREEMSLVFTPVAPLAPETTYTVRLGGDLESQRGRLLKDEIRWQFQTRQSYLLYIAPDEDNLDQLFSISPDGGEPAQLTQEPYGIFDYALSPDAATIAYSALREDGGSDLWALSTQAGERTALLMCPGSVCSGVAWMPNSDRLVYERRVMLVTGAAPGPPRLWWFSLTTGDTLAVFEDNQIIGYGATWSSDGQWLSYVAPSSQGIQVYNIQDGRNLIIPSRMGSTAVWKPQADSLLVSDIQRGDEGFVVHLLHGSPASGELFDLTGQAERVEDSSPAWSPDGAWIAFTRKIAGASMGKQIWLMRTDGSEARYLTNDTDIHHGLPTWSADGRFLAYQRFPLKEIGARPGVWILDVETGQTREVVTPGNRPTWLP